MWWTAAALLLGAVSNAADSPTDICKRWSHQTALVNGTIYIYGGQATTTAGQSSDTWNNNFLTLTVKQDWGIDAPNLMGLPQPKGPPRVANGYLWHNDNQLFLYGGLYSDKPPAEPEPEALWEYDIASGKWSQEGQDGIKRAAEGAGVSVPGRSLGFYFGGHLDGYTTPGWSQSVPRVYLKSLLEFDMATGKFTNHTGGGLEKAGVPERADGVLVFVPWGDEGILLAIGGGTNETFSQMNVIDVYSLGSRKWTKQSTDGPPPKYRVNPCAAVASAPDGSSYQIYFFGGQNLVPYAEQLQYDDMYILTIPAFQWIKIDMSNQSIPPARAGHTCDIVGRQMVVIGGFTSTELSCDSPGIYVFDATTLEWTTGYSSAAGGFSNNKDHPYKVPQAVIDIVGGDKNGGATITKPVKTAVPDSPMVTGDAGDYKYTTFVPRTTIALSTAPDGTVTTSTVTPNPEVTPGGGAAGPHVGSIVGGVVGSIVAVVSLILGGAFWLYKRKIRQLREIAPTKYLPVAGYGDKMGEDVVMGRNTATATTAAARSSLDLEGEPTFWGVLMSPRRSLRVVNN